MKTTAARLFLALGLIAFPTHGFAASFLVENGKPRAEIVIASDPPRATRLAAHELQTSLEKISGAKLPIATTPSADVPVKVYVGASSHTMEKEIEEVDTALTMFDAAKANVSQGSTYAERLALIDNFLYALRSKARILAQGRGPVPRLRTVWEPQTPIKIDGKLDEPYWIKHRQWSVGRLRELQTGARPVFGTTVMAGWDRGGQNVYFAIRCEERPGEKLNVTAKQHDDQALFYGDAIEIELDTDKHSYYQIAVNPAGAIVDLALEAYRQIAASTTATGSAEYFTGLQGAARILTRRGEYDEALKMLDLVDAEKLGGSWGVTLLFARARHSQQQTARRTLKASLAVLTSESATQRQRDAAGEAIKAIEKNQ